MSSFCLRATKQFSGGFHCLKERSLVCLPEHPEPKPQELRERSLSEGEHKGEAPEKRTTRKLTLCGRRKDRLDIYDQTDARESEINSKRAAKL